MIIFMLLYVFLFLFFFLLCIMHYKIKNKHYLKNKLTSLSFYFKILLFHRISPNLLHGKLYIKHTKDPARDHTWSNPQ